MLQKETKKLSVKNMVLRFFETAGKKNFILILLIIAAALIFAMPDFSGKEKETLKDESIEKRLENILSEVNGAGKVKVMIVFSDDGKNDIAMNTNYFRESGGNEKSEKTAVLNGDREAVIVQKNIPGVQGVIITAQGAYDETVKENLKKAALAVLPVMEHRIEILPAKRE